MLVTVEDIKTLRDMTGAGIMDSKRALEESGGDVEMAQQILKDKGIATAAKKASRETNEGLIHSYIHTGSRVGAIVEVNCETDFVARTDDLKSLSTDLAMQIASMSPKYVNADEMEDSKEGDPEDLCLLSQPFIRDGSLTVQDIVNETIAKVGENIRIRRFSRFALGE